MRRHIKFIIVGGLLLTVGAENLFVFDSGNNGEPPIRLVAPSHPWFVELKETEDMIAKAGA